MRRTLSSLLIRSSRLLCWSRSFRVLRVWTRSGATCEITIPRPALPAPISNLRNTQAQQSDALVQLQSALLLCVNLVCLTCMAIILLFLLPVGVGLLINLVFITPFQVGPEKTLIIGFWEHWIFGIMHLKVAILLVVIGPPWWFRRRLEHVQNELMQYRYHARTSYILLELAPLIVSVGMSLSVPYLLAQHVGPALGLATEYAVRYVYIALLLTILAIVLIIIQMRNLKKLYVRIKNEKSIVFGILSFLSWFIAVGADERHKSKYQTTR